MSLPSDPGRVPEAAAQADARIACEHADRCGGCPIIALSYGEQLSLKRGRVVQSVARYASLELVYTEPVAPADPIIAYRTRAKLIVSPGPRIGLFEKGGGHNVIDIPRCRVLSPPLLAVAEALRARADADGRSGGTLAPFDPSGRGGLRAVDLREVHDPKGGDPRVLVTFVVQRSHAPALDALRRRRRPSPRRCRPSSASPSTSTKAKPRRSSVARRRYCTASPPRRTGSERRLISRPTVRSCRRTADRPGASTRRSPRRCRSRGAAPGPRRGARRACSISTAGQAPSPCLWRRRARTSSSSSRSRRRSRTRRRRPCRKGCRSAPSAPTSAGALRVLHERGEAFDLAVVNPPTPRDERRRARRSGSVRSRRNRLRLVRSRHARARSRSPCPPRLRRDRAPPARHDPAHRRGRDRRALAADTPSRRRASSTRTTRSSSSRRARTSRRRRRGSTRARSWRGCGGSPAPRGRSPSTGSTSGRAASSCSRKKPELVARWAEALRRRGARKIYVAGARGVTPSKGAITRELREDGKSYPARTRYRRLAVASGHSVLRVIPEQGRTHQIRRHLAAIGHPVLGDDRYGHVPTNRFFEEKNGLDRAFLHCVRLELDHPRPASASSSRRRCRATCAPCSSGRAAPARCGSSTTRTRSARAERRLEPAAGARLVPRARQRPRRGRELLDDSPRAHRCR